MTTFQKVVKYLATALAIFLAVSIIGGILSAVGIFGVLLNGGNVLEDAKTYTISNDITKLDIQINAADFTIKQADEFLVESNIKNLTVKEKNGVLTIKEAKSLGISYNDAMLVFYVPEDALFDKADITTGAGRVTMGSLSADSLSLELGAGEVEIGSLNANKIADINGGAGRITISDGSLCNLDLDMGVGQLNLTSAVVGNSELDLGIGETNLTLIGSKNDYNIDSEKGIGRITLNGQNISDFVGGGKNNIDINGGIGAVNISFTE